MSTAAPKHTPLRQSILGRVGWLVSATVVMVSAGFMLFGLSPMSERVAQNRFNLAASKVEASLGATLLPAANLLTMASGWLKDAPPDLDDPADFNRIFEPIIAVSTSITSVVAGTSDGQGWLLLGREDGSWRNRMTDIPRWGDRRHLFLDRDAQGRLTRAFRETEYDPRKRPWFKAAMEGGQPVNWTAPYTFFTTGDPGVTVSTRRQLSDGRDFVLGFDLKLRDLSRTTMQSTVSENGMAMVLTDDHRVLALPAAPAGVAPADWLKLVLKPASELKLDVVNDFVTFWQRSGKRAIEVGHFYSRGTRWLTAVEAYPLGKQVLWVVTLSPASDFAPPWLAVSMSLVLATLLILIGALLFVRHDARRIAEPLEKLAEAARRIGDLDFRPEAPLSSRVREIRALADAQERMRSLLEANQIELSRQAAQLEDQVDALTKAERRLLESNAYNQLLFADSPSALIVLDPATYSLVDCNQAAVKLFGVESREALLTRRPKDLFPPTQPDGRPSTELGREHVASALQERSHAFEWVCLRADGATWEAEVHMMRFAHGDRTLLQFSLQDITQRKAAAGAIRRLAFYDTLTELPNRRMLTDKLAEAISHCLQQGTHGALLFIDLDNFKSLNDTLGHDRGDQLLQQVAHRLIASVNDSDTVGRFGGDEFLVMLEGLSGSHAEAVQQTEAISARILAALNRPYDLAGHEHHSTPSIGIALFAEAGDTVDELLKRADIAMYQAKAAGRNVVRFYDPQIQATVTARAALAMELWRAVRDRQFTLHFQKQVDANGRPVGAEALLRWKHPVKGLIFPGEFIELAEQTALILPIGQWVLESACSQLAAWQAADPGRDFVLAVNVSGRQLRDEGFVSQVEQILQDTGADPRRLKLELTESTLLEDIEGAISKMQRLRAMGIRFALDDFGTGFSSLGYLKRLPIEQLKIDQSFVRDILSDPNDASIAATIIALAQNLGISVIAEGVETQAQRDFLARNGCGGYQGYLFGRPGPAESLFD